MRLWPTLFDKQTDYVPDHCMRLPTVQRQDPPQMSYRVGSAGLATLHPREESGMAGAVFVKKPPSLDMSTSKGQSYTSPSQRATLGIL